MASGLAGVWIAFCLYIRFRKGRLEVRLQFWGVHIHPTMNNHFVWMIGLILTNSSDDAPVSIKEVRLRVDRETAKNHVFFLDSPSASSFGIPESEIERNAYLAPQQSITGKMMFIDPIGPAFEQGATPTITDSQDVVHRINNRYASNPDPAAP